MVYYKIIMNAQIIGVSTSNQCYCFQAKHSMLKRTIASNAEYLECLDTLYHAWWMEPIKTNLYQYQIADIIEITEQEYNILAPISEPIPIEEDDDIPEEPVVESIDPVEEITIEYVRSSKLQEMSRICRTTIETGFDLIIRGETHHFSLTTQDQLNLMNLNVMAQTQDLIPYHADGEECVFYTPEEIKEIIAAATNFKNYQIAYHNALKAYINALDTIEAIAAIEYGTPIPDEYKSDVLRVLE